MARAVVTGGAGFIGSHLVERLIDDGHEVVILDNLATGRLENIASVKDNSALAFHQVDVADFDAINPHFRGADWVFHLAALADIVPSIERPLEYHNANINGTAAVLEAARHNDVQRFVYTASSSCYGLPDTVPTDEAAAIRPMYPYAMSKYVGEQLALHWNKVYGQPTVSLRLFNVYGPRSRTGGTYGAVFGVFLAQKLAGQPFTVVGDGEQSRDFTFVTDIVDAFVRAAESDVEGRVFNVGSGGTYTINHLVELLGGDVVHIAKRPGEPDCTFADTNAIHEALGFAAKIPFAAGVGMMLDSIENWRNAPVWNEASIAEATTDWFRYLG